MLDHNF